MHCANVFLHTIIGCNSHPLKDVRCSLVSRGHLKFVFSDGLKG
jgi:hypothetical protein